MTVTASFEQFSKKRGGRFAVQELTFDVQAGRVVGLIGPNGAGKSTALAGLTGLVEPTSGRATVFGTDYRSLRRPATKVGVNLDGMDIEPGLTGLRHLQICQLAAGAERQAVDQILEQVDLAAEAKKKVRDYSLGMRQRLGGIASALIGRPPSCWCWTSLPTAWTRRHPVVAPIPQGLRCFRRQCVGLEHQLMELEQVADEVVILKQRTLFQGTLKEAKALGGGSLESAYFKILDRAR